MARSYRKTPLIGCTTARSEKYDKRRANRDLRAAARVVMATFDPESSVLPIIREVSSVYRFAKDGKFRIRVNDECEKKFMRK